VPRRNEYWQLQELHYHLQHYRYELSHKNPANGFLYKIEFFIAYDRLGPNNYVARPRRFSAYFYTVNLEVKGKVNINKAFGFIAVAS